MPSRKRRKQRSSMPKRDAHAHALHNQVMIGRDQLEFTRHFRQWNRIDPISLHTNHLSKLSLRDQLRGMTA